MEIPEQIVLPVCPHAWGNRLRIRIGEQEKHVQDIKPVYHFYELFNGVRVVEVSSLRHMSHEQVMPHQSLNLLCLVRIESQTVEGTGHKGRPLRRMPLARALGRGV